MNLWHQARVTCAYGLRLVPRRSRYGAAVLFSKPLVPLLSRSPAFRAQLGRYQDGARDLALFHVLDAMTKAGTTFELAADVEGADNLTRALERRRGAFVCGVHSLLNFVTPRLLHDLGHTPLVITVDGDMRIPGTTLTGHALVPSPTFMLRVRSRWREGGLVCAAIDNDVPSKRGRTSFDTALGTSFVMHPLLALALRCAVPVVFVAARVDPKRGLVFTFGASSAAVGTEVERVAHEMAGFVRQHARRVVARDAESRAPSRETS